MRLLILIMLVSLAGCCPPCQAAEPSDMDEERVIALTILGEARNQDAIGMRCVAQVIKNRADQRDMSLKDVCLARLQFSCWNAFRERTEAIWRESEEAARTAEILATLIYEGYDVARDIIGGANHYYNPRIIIPYWAKDIDGIQVEDHIFIEL